MASDNSTKKKELWKKNWPDKINPEVTFPYGEVPISTCLANIAKKDPDRAATIFYGAEMTFRQWDDDSNRMANALSKMGYGKGDTAHLYLHNCPQLFVAYMAAMKLGMIVFFADPGFKAFEMKYCLGDSGAQVVFAFDNNYENLQELHKGGVIKDVIVTSFQDVLPEKATLPLHPILTEAKRVFEGTHDFVTLLKENPADPLDVPMSMDEPEVVMYTGGTTGMPKGAVHTHKNALLCGAWAHQVRDLGVDLSPCESVLVFGPLGHVGALSYSFYPACVHGRTSIIMARFDAETVLKAIDQYQIELFVGTVVVIQGLMKHPDFKKYNLKSVKKWLLGEWMVWLTDEIAKEWEAQVGIRPSKWGYGQTETLNVIPDGGRIGREIPFKDKFMMAAIPPIPSFDVRILDFETREDLPFGEKGEIVIKGPARCKYYWNKPKETAESLSPEGWFYSGDIGMLDEEGYLYWFGRKKSLIRVSGFQVSGSEIEMIGRECPHIANICVFPKKHPKKGQVPLAFVELTAGCSVCAEDLTVWYKAHIAAYKVPEIQILDKLPMTPKGSIDMKKLATDFDLQ